MEPGAYDVLMKVSSYGAGFVLASNVVVREGTLTHINPNPLVGGIGVEPVSKKGFPLIKNLQFIDLSSGDKRLLAQVRATPPAQLGERAFPFRDTRYPELLFRYRARNWPQTLDAEERVRWDNFRRARLSRHTALTGLTLDDYFTRLRELRNDPAAQDRLALLDQLQAWGERLAASID